jgi:hypothetical protein
MSDDWRNDLVTEKQKEKLRFLAALGMKASQKDKLVIQLTNA